MWPRSNDVHVLCKPQDTCKEWWHVLLISWIIICMLKVKKSLIVGRLMDYWFCQSLIFCADDMVATINRTLHGC